MQHGASTGGDPCNQEVQHTPRLGDFSFPCLLRPKCVSSSVEENMLVFMQHLPAEDAVLHAVPLRFSIRLFSPPSPMSGAVSFGCGLLLALPEARSWRRAVGRSPAAGGCQPGLGKGQLVPLAWRGPLVILP